MHLMLFYILVHVYIDIIYFFSIIIIIIIIILFLMFLSSSLLSSSLSFSDFATLLVKYENVTLVHNL